MKKIPILFLSILISALLLTPIKPTLAMMEARDTTWWTVEELLEFYQEVEAEKDAECGDNQDCRMEFGFSMIERGDKYSALNNLLESQFWITSINPEAETIKVLFFDDDMMLRHMGIEEKLELENLHIGWTEDWLGHGYYHNFDAPFDDFMPGVHQLFNSEIEDVASIIPWQENEFPMLDSNISSNSTGVLYFTIYAKNNMFNAQGSTSYADCLNSPDYQAGMECKLYISGNQWASYFPPRNLVLVEEMPTMEVVEPDDTETNNSELDNTEPEPIADQNNTESDPTTEADVIGSEPIIETDEITLEITETGNNDASNMNDASTTENDVEPTPEVHAPETGVMPAESSNVVEFPWWLGVIAALNILTLTWLFLPIHIKTPKKTTNRHRINKAIAGVFRKSIFPAKKYQKTLDKNPYQR